MLGVHTPRGCPLSANRVSAICGGGLDKDCATTPFVNCEGSPARHPSLTLRFRHTFAASASSCFWAASIASFTEPFGVSARWKFCMTMRPNWSST